MARLAVLLLSGLTFATNASATVFLGNPKLGVHAEVGDAWLAQGWTSVSDVTVVYCDGTEEVHPIDDDVDLATGFSFDAGTGDACSLRIEWTSTIELDSDEFSLEDWSVVTEVPLSGAVQSAALNEWVVTSGTVPSEQPMIVVEID